MSPDLYPWAILYGDPETVAKAQAIGGLPIEALPEKAAIYPWMVAFVFIFLFGAFIKNRRVVLGAFIPFLVGCCLFFLTPEVGILVRGAALWQQPQVKSALVSKHPLPAGSAVFIFEIVNKDFLKVKTPDGKFGYIEMSAARLR